jgi:hypothetical protein
MLRRPPWHWSEGIATQHYLENTPLWQVKSIAGEFRRDCSLLMRFKNIRSRMQNDGDSSLEPDGTPP